MHAAGSITVSGGALIGEGNEAASSSGVTATASITASGGSITGTGGVAAIDGGYSYGVYVEDDSGFIRVVNGGSITGTGKEAYKGYSYGLYAKGAIDMIKEEGSSDTDGGTIKGTAERYGTNVGCGVWTNGLINLPTDNFRIEGKGEMAFYNYPKYFPGDVVYYWRTAENGAYEHSDGWRSVYSELYFDVRSPLPVITFSTQPASTTVTQSSITGSLTAAASVSPSGTATLNWYACDASGKPRGTSLRTGGSFTIPTDLTAGTHYYLCQAEYTDVKKNSSVATVTVNPPAPTVYEITQGQHSQWLKGSGKELGFTADADYSKFTNGGSVSVDGSVIAGSNYTSQSGSTVVTLNAAYLETLSAGRHTLRINFTDGYAETHFTIAAQADVPKTGDAATPALWLGLMLLASAGLAVNTIRRRKRQNG